MWNPDVTKEHFIINHHDENCGELTAMECRSGRKSVWGPSKYEYQVWLEDNIWAAKKKRVLLSIESCFF